MDASESHAIPERQPKTRRRIHDDEFSILQGGNCCRFDSHATAKLGCAGFKS
jgi:hypothetical protein